MRARLPKRAIAVLMDCSSNLNLSRVTAGGRQCLFADRTPHGPSDGWGGGRAGFVPGRDDGRRPGPDAAGATEPDRGGVRVARWNGELAGAIEGRPLGVAVEKLTTEIACGGGVAGDNDRGDSNQDQRLDLHRPVWSATAR